jgi:glycosyltransferase involved in cell wall biosynthesis
MSITKLRRKEGLHYADGPPGLALGPPSPAAPRVLSVYEGFFAGGARALHSGVVAELHRTGGSSHSVLSIFREMRRESLLQVMTADSRYQALRLAGVRVASLGRRAHHTDLTSFTERELDLTARHVWRSDVVLALKEQPLHLLNHPGLPERPTVVCLHRTDPEHQGQAFTELRTAVDAGRIAVVVCCAEATRQAYRDAGIPDRLLTVIPNGVDLARFRPVTARSRRRIRRSLGLPATAPVVVFAARYDGMKNVPLLLAAAREFLHRRSDAHVVMCGAGMTAANTELYGQIQARIGDDPRLLLLGIRDDMPAIYAAADVVALTSSTGEAAPLCLIEGMMCGAVPVTTDIGDCSSIVDGYGFVVDPSPVAIAAAWEEAAARRAERAPALRRARSRFSHGRMTAAYAAVIAQVTGSRAPVPVRALG